MENMLSELHQAQTNPFVSLDFQHRTAREHCVNLNDCEILVLIPAIIVLLTSNLKQACNRCRVTLGLQFWQIIFHVTMSDMVLPVCHCYCHSARETRRAGGRSTCSGPWLFIRPPI